MLRMRARVAVWSVLVIGVTWATVALPAEAAAATPRCHGHLATVFGVAPGGGNLVGTPGPDVIVGGPGDDRIRGRGGDDLVCALGGDDAVAGGGGVDRIDAGPGDDRLLGGRGADRLTGRSGRDSISGGPGPNHIHGGPGTDVCRGSHGDTMRSCNEADTPPLAVDDTATVAEDSGPTTIDVLADDTDPDGGPRSVHAVTQPTHGTVRVARGGVSLTYEPNPGYCNDGSATDDFTYRLAPGVSSARVAVTVTCTDDAPRAVDDTKSVGEEALPTAVDVLANDTDADGGPLSVSGVTQPAHGTVVVTGGGSGLTYEPDASYCNDGSPTDDFDYTLAPGGSSATVSVTVVCVDDVPVAVDDTATVEEDAAATAIPVLANDVDPDSGPRTITGVTPPADGTVTVTGGGSGLTYRPDADYCDDGSPTDDFTYTLAPGSSTATVAVTVTCVDDAPVAADDAVTVDEDSGATPVDVLANDSDGDGGPQLVDSVTQPSDGAVVITGGGTGLTYQPDPQTCNDGAPTDDFTYTLAPGGDTATVAVTVVCFSATISPNPDVIASAQAGSPVNRSYTVENTGPAFTGRLEAGPLSSARVARPTIADGGSQQFQVAVAAGATSLTATIGNPVDADADLDLFLYDCTTGSCVLAAQDATVAAEQTVSVSNPAAGVWIVLVEGYTVPSGSTAYDYVDFFVTPALGQFSVTDANSLRAPASSWTVPGTIQGNTAPGAGRVLRAVTRVVTSAGKVVGTGSVIVQAVTSP